MKSKHGWMIWGLVTALLLLGSPAFISAAERRPEQETVARVNGKDITQAELEREVIAVLGTLSRQGKTPEESQMGVIRKNVLEGLIGTELLLQESKKKGIKVDPAAVDSSVQAVKSRFPSEEEFKNALAKSGHSESSMRAQIEKGLLIQAFINQEIVQKITVSPEESKAFYDSHPESFKQPEAVQVSHILIKVDSKAEADQKAKARWEIEGIQKRLKKGEDLAALAKEHSQCPSSAQGGDLGFIVRGQTVKPFEDVAFSLKAGETSGIVETEYGYHIIRVTEKVPASTIPYEQAKDGIEKHLKEAKIRTELNRYVDALKAKSKVEILLKDS